ncbi:histidine kinase [Hymenobacter cellulosilyticus]|uniref:Signal transduction histidine kinase osmosensitive K+ channel sensor N-terminal domain-containing protein n=1 Tax=Hymenobacter cellulosilyticus TaxID=2932248 RepID=A0A8T9Q0L0_9BACT|nr:hypothetical protein [Hymenobacter cellulosilyticus]UOQ70907.1 hypothetical protein MUN79_19815 [Hymenobacter cellulosilyticus]
MRSSSEQARRDQSAERFLRLVQGKRRGTLKVYLGLAAGVGKTYRMLQEALDLHQHGVDVLLGYIETHGRAGTVAQLPSLPLLPRKQLFYKGRALEEMDLDGIVQRRPQVVVVDELAHSNVPGSRHDKRWQDVEFLVAQGISVITAVNVQHLESLHDQVLKITGTDVTERIPDQLLKQADEVVNVDLTVGELRTRLQEGKIYDPAKVPTALLNFFQAENLLQLRRLAVREVAQLLSRQVETDAGGTLAVAPSAATTTGCWPASTPTTKPPRKSSAKPPAWPTSFRPPPGTCSTCKPLRKPPTGSTWSPSAACWATCSWLPSWAPRFCASSPTTSWAPSGKWRPRKTPRCWSVASPGKKACGSNSAAAA